MSDRLCIIYEVPRVDDSRQIRSGYYPTKQEAFEVAKNIGRRVYKIEVAGASGIREAVCQIAEHVGWVKDKEEVADFRERAPAEPFEG